MEWMRPSLLPVINATGVVLHTNLGGRRSAGLPCRRCRALRRVYSNLEFDLESGQRGSRLVHAEALLQTADRRRGGAGGQ